MAGPPGDPKARREGLLAGLRAAAGAPAGADAGLARVCGPGLRDCGVAGAAWRLEETSWKYCDGGPAEGFSVTEVDVSPPRRGQELDVKVVGKTPRLVTGGRLLIKAFYGWFNIWNARENLCKRAECPIEPGSIEVRTVQKLPEVAPRGLYRAYVRVLDESELELICIQLHLRIESGEPQAEFK